MLADCESICHILSRAKQGFPSRNLLPDRTLGVRAVLWCDRPSLPPSFTPHPHFHSLSLSLSLSLFFFTSFLFPRVFLARAVLMPPLARSQT